MTLTQELEALVGAYLNGRSSLEDIRAWLIDHAQDTVDAADARLDEMDGELWLLISEYDRRDRDEASVRTEAERLVTVTHTSTYWDTDVATLPTPRSAGMPGTITPANGRRLDSPTWSPGLRRDPALAH